MIAAVSWNQLQLNKAAEIARGNRELRGAASAARACTCNQRAALSAHALEDEKPRAGGDPARLAKVEKQIVQAKECESVLEEEGAKGLNELEEARKKLAHMGLSPMGYEWIPASVRDCIDGGSLHVG